MQTTLKRKSICLNGKERDSGKHSKIAGNINEILIRQFYQMAKLRDDLQTFHGYGTTTMASNQKILTHLFSNTNKTEQIKFLDVGSGWGNVIYHAAVGFEVFSTGVEIEEQMCDWSLEKCENEGIDIANESIQDFDISGYTHIYTYDKIFSKEILQALANKMNDSIRWTMFASYHPIQEWEALGLELELLETVDARSQGKQKFTCYVYTRKQ
jgi:2-polyprenyl-3-methyl-5-hydroxy-6-metoxy-1,4-benzoquinol methylase